MHNLRLNANNEQEGIIYTNSVDTNDVEMQLSKTRGKKNNMLKCLTTSGICFILVLVVGVVLGYFTWMVFAIKALNNTSNSDIKDKCKKSDIWILMLVIIIISGGTLLSNLTKQKETDESSNKVCVGIIQLCLQIALTIWAGLELNTNCAKNNLNDEDIYVLLNYWFYFGCVSIIITIMLWCIYCCLMTKFMNSD